MKTLHTVLLLLVFCSISLVVAQEDDGDVIISGLQEEIDLIEANTSYLRGLEALEDVAVAFPTRDDLTAYLIDELEVYYTPERTAHEMALFAGFGFLPPDYDLPAGLLKFYQEQVAGFYESDTKTMNVILLSGVEPTTHLPLLERIIYAHEYVHALQDQHFDLSKYEETLENENNDDRALALQALVEGDAAAVHNDYLMRTAESNPVGSLLELGMGMFQAENLFLPEGTPNILGSVLLFPYTAGERFVLYLVDAGGWEAVDQAHLDPPTSSEQILHPQRYLDGDWPIEVDLAQRSEAPGPGWMWSRSGTLGEFYLREWLELELIDAEQAKIAAAGWGGDTYQMYYHEDEGFAWHLRIVWDEPADAREFATALEAWAASRLPDSIGEGYGFYHCWTLAEALCLQVSQSVVTDVIFAPSRSVAEALMN